MSRTASDVLQEALNDIQRRRERIQAERKELTQHLASTSAALAALSNEETDLRVGLGKLNRVDA